ncbi:MULTISPECIES: hypothetical protein [Bacillus]|nr:MULTISPECIES: hypothetical protein [Bacillus]AHC44452.1 hypothetical protein U722_17355 [Bacillus amyloliquefaciens LFB112]AMQ71424.1 hypothetical protein BAMY6639_08220 [Bacillus amyloliquefaciens UMAF6639]MCT6681270.1 hypothetical protein [Bacillus velezensis]MEC0404959.1 hypothetical protein [Bacillus velezensis]WBY40593.1 hypothetical protein PF986_12480 [Bacillus velezensis]
MNIGVSEINKIKDGGRAFYGRITMSAPNLIGTLSHLHSPFLL